MSTPPPTDLAEAVPADRFATGVSLDPERAVALRRTLEDPPLFLAMPAELAGAFQRHRVRDLHRYVRIAAPWLVALAVGLALLQTTNFERGFPDAATRFWSLTTTMVCVVVAVGSALVQVPYLRRRHELVVSPAASFVLLKLALVPQILGDVVIARVESYFCMLSIFLISVALRLRLATLAAILLGTGAVALLFVLTVAPTPDPTGFAYSFGPATVVGLFVAWQLEEKEKVAFLQGVLIDHDAHLLEAMNHELLRLARHDALTGLVNRRELGRRLEAEWERLRRDGKPLAVVFTDIDHFKAYNDTFGHAAGDDCLARVAGALGSCLRRPADFAARYGGEEFVLVLPDTDLAGAVDVAQRALEAVDALAIAHPGREPLPHVTASFGVAAAIPADSPSAEGLLRRADEALYSAKYAGRHQISVA